MTPRIPFVDPSPLTLLPEGTFGAGSPAIALQPFGLLVATGVCLTAWLTLREGARRGLDREVLSSFSLWVTAAGFVFAHVIDVLCYAPARLLDEPWVLLTFWDGLSSYGGFLGAAIGALVWRRRHGTSIAATALLPLADVLASSFPMGWVFGRAGCSVVHDHPGVSSQAWFAVLYPGGGRLDLGLIELVLTLPLAFAFLTARRRAHAPGFFLGWLCVIYALARFPLDFLRAADPVVLPAGVVLPDPRYLGLTPAQWASLPLAAVGIELLRRSGCFERGRPASDPNADGAGQQARADR